MNEMNDGREAGVCGIALKSGYTGAPMTMDELKANVGEGWHGILDRLVNDLFELGWNGVVCQLKEKYGGLRFYCGATSETMGKRIAEAERESDVTCEDCGTPGKIAGPGWLRCLCDLCREARFVGLSIQKAIDDNKVGNQ